MCIPFLLVKIRRLLAFRDAECENLLSFDERKLANYWRIDSFICLSKGREKWHTSCNCGLTEAAMKTVEIPRDEWKRFFENFSRKQEGFQVTLEVFGPDIGDQVEERQMFFAGVTADLAHGSDKIEIMMGGKPSGHVTHMILEPILVELQKTDLGIESTLQIKSADGTTSLLHLN
jgi:Family of unknown function (DUF5335)